MPGVDAGAEPDFLMTKAKTIVKRLEPLFEADAEVLRHTVWISVWGRWLIWLAGVAMLARRPDTWYPEQIEFVYLSVSLAAINGLVHYLLLRKRPVTWRWMIALSAADLALITANVAVNVAATGNPDNLVFIAYYPSLAIFAVVFSSLRLVVAWVTMAAVVYSLVSVTAGPGIDLSVGQDNMMLARLFVMYLVTVGVTLITRFERARRQAALARERRLQQERVELSQAIHDTNAQTAYLIGLGIENAMRLAGDANPELTEQLDATAALSKSSMWELRGPIDVGRIFEGRDLGRVLGAHTSNFSSITSVPAEMAQSGEEPPLPTDVKTGLFSIAHNALANAFLHARASEVKVDLEFGEDGVRLSVSDDGVGLPDDYAERGRGFSGMEKAAARMGGKLIVQSGGPDEGTIVTCVVSREFAARGD